VVLDRRRRKREKRKRDLDEEASGETRRVGSCYLEREVISYSSPPVSSNGREILSLFFSFLNEFGACEPWLHNPTSGLYFSPGSCIKFIVFD
jgi:hypothetical protein